MLALDRHGRVALDSGRIDGLDPGGGTFGPDGRTTSAYGGAGRSSPCLLVSTKEENSFFPTGSSHSRGGFGFGADGELYLASGVGPSGEGENTIAVFDQGGALRTPRLVLDPELSPLDLTLAPNGNIIVASEWPFGSRDAMATVREYDPSTRRLVRVFAPEPAVGFARPRGLRFGPDGRLYCVGKDHVVAFDFSTGRILVPSRDYQNSTAKRSSSWDSCPEAFT